MYLEQFLVYTFTHMHTYTCLTSHVIHSYHNHAHTYTLQAVISMMDEMDLIRKWKIPRKTIAR